MEHFQKLFPQDEPRPLLITIICLLGFVYITTVLLMSLFIADLRIYILTVFGTSFFSVMLINNLLILMSLVGFWRMQRWGFWLFLICYLIGALYGSITDIEFLWGYIPGFLIILAGAFHLKEMS